MTTSSPRDSYHHGDLREALVVAALEAIEAQGIEAVQLRTIAKQLQVAHPAVYRHFDSREALVIAALVRGHEQLRSALYDEDDKRADPRRFLIRFGARYADFALSHSKLFLAMTGPRMTSDDSENALNTAIEVSFAPIIEAVKQGQVEGVFCEGHPRALGVYFWAALQGVLTQIVHRRIGVRGDRLPAFIEDVVRRILRGIES